MVERVKSNIYKVVLALWKHVEACDRANPPASRECQVTRRRRVTVDIRGCC